MTNQRIVRKSKAGVQDVILGKGPVTQTRGVNEYQIDRLDIPLALDTTAEMQALDVDDYTRARVYSDAATFVDYIYDEAATVGIAPTEGVGFWVIANLDINISNKLVTDSVHSSTRTLANWHGIQELSYPSMTAALADPLLSVNSQVTTSGNLSLGDGLGGVYDVVLTEDVVLGEYTEQSTAVPALSLTQRIGWNGDNLKYYNEKLQSVKSRMEAGEAVKIVTLGDSITAGTYPFYLGEYLRGYYKNSSITVVAKAFSGYRSDQILAQWPTAVTAENPDMVVLMAGMNDALQYASGSIKGFTDSMQAMYQLAVNEGRSIISMNITPTMVFDTDVKRHIKLYRDAGVAVADRRKVPNLDMNSLMLELIQTSDYNWYDMYADKIHPREEGEKQIAGALLCHLLASERLVMTVGSKVPPIEPYFVYSDAANVTFTEPLAPNVALARITPTTSVDGATLYFWYEGYKFSNLALECTMEGAAAKSPKVVVNNTEISGTGIASFKLGRTTGNAFDIANVPINACRLKPGFNSVDILSDSTSSAEFGTAKIVLAEPIYTKLDENETFTQDLFPHSYADLKDRVSRVLATTGAPHNVPAGGVTYVGDIKNPTLEGMFYRLRCLPTTGFTLSMCRRNEFASEYQLSVDIKFEQNGLDIDITTTATSTGGAVAQIDFTKQASQTLNIDTKLDILMAMTAAVGGDTTVYKNNQLVATIPFTVGNTQLIAKSVGAGGSMLNSLSAVSPQAGLVSEVDGETWIDFVTPATKMTINGTIETV
tara:strand:+ start:5748 stop:8051 length:2304 start_codon:yes stop_codon:yes gene_type:complete